MFGTSLPAPAVFSAVLGGMIEQSTLPPFQQQPRDRYTMQGGMAWQPSPEVRLSAQVDGWRWDRYTGEQQISGPGDITLGVDVTPWNGLGAMWLVKQPNAEDEQGLGSDETDLAMLGQVQRRWGGAVLGVSVRGDPLRYSAQDVAVMGWMVGRKDVGPLHASLRVGGVGPSAQNPARIDGALGLRGGCRMQGGGELRAGLSPAAADWGIQLWMGMGWGCGKTANGRT